MKIHVLSDLHIEIARWPRNIDLKAVDADVTVLAGDIGSGLQGLEFALSIDRPVVYVMGNHEFYGKRGMDRLWEKLRERAAGTNVQILENESFTISGVRFLGCTLWSDFALHGQSAQVQSMLTCSLRMSDYRYIRKTRYSTNGQFLLPDDTLTFHLESRTFLERELAEPFDGKTVAVSHHAPSRQSVKTVDRFSGERASALNVELYSAFASHLEGLVDQSDLWIHGHTHLALDYRIGNGRVVSNPRGYGGIAEVQEFDPFLVIEA
ncbi:MAG: metallophosphoesterase family protein [Halothiobacillus sp.]|jgi:predicted phosphodiesterase|nr:metallophosphoesterase family protein [Halothiobacillus sp.]